MSAPATLPLLPLEPAMVGADGFKEDFPCYLQWPRQYWNGFDCPYFTHATGLRILAGLLADEKFPAKRAEFDAARDVFIVQFKDDEPWEFECTGALPDGTKLYAIGAWSWCWEENVNNEGGAK